MSQWDTTDYNYLQSTIYYLQKVKKKRKKKKGKRRKKKKNIISYLIREGRRLRHHLQVAIALVGSPDGGIGYTGNMAQIWSCARLRLMSCQAENPCIVWARDSVPHSLKGAPGRSLAA